MSQTNKNIERNKTSVSYRLSVDRNTSGKTTLYEELRLIERNEHEINSVWKGAHITLFFLAFVFGSFCTCCFQMLMHMFNDKCILFPKLISHPSIAHIIREFFSIKVETEDADLEPFEYVSTQWAEYSVCYLPTYVPLVSGLAGLVWTTMFFMSGTSNVTGAQRHWRAMPLMFVFSVAMASLCMYASSITHSGLQELCSKLAEVTGSQCSYTINVVALAFERRIRGVYQLTHLSIASAWMHTTCWILSALLIVLRVVLAVDFTLVRIKAELIGDLDDMLQKYEKQVDTISADLPDTPKSDIQEDDSEEELYTIGNTSKQAKTQIQFKMGNRDTIDDTMQSKDLLESSIVPAEQERPENILNINNVSKGESESSSASLKNTHRSSDATAPEKTPLINNIGREESRSSKASLEITTGASHSTAPEETPQNIITKIGKVESRSSNASLENTRPSSSHATAPKKSPHEIHHDTKSIDSVEIEKVEEIAKELVRKIHGQLAEEFKKMEQGVKSNLKLQGLTSDSRRIVIPRSDGDDSKVTEDSKKTDEHGEEYIMKTENRKTDGDDIKVTEDSKKTYEHGEKYGMKTENKKTDGELPFSPASSRKLFLQDEKEKSEENKYIDNTKEGITRSDISEENDNKYDKAEYSGLKQTVKKNENIKIEKSEGTVQPYTPLHISDHVNTEPEQKSTDKIQKEEKKEDGPKDVDKAGDNDKSDSKDMDTRDTKDKEH